MIILVITAIGTETTTVAAAYHKNAIEYKATNPLQTTQKSSRYKWNLEFHLTAIHIPKIISAMDCYDY